MLLRFIQMGQAVLMFHRQIARAVVLIAMGLLCFTFAQADDTIINRMERSTVRIETNAQLNGEVEINGQTIGPGLVSLGAGSGFVIEANHIVTNAHVAFDRKTAVLTLAEYQVTRDMTQDAVNAVIAQVAAKVVDTVPVITLGQNDEIQARVVWWSEKKDLAVLKAERNLNIPPVEFATRTMVTKGQKVLVLGFPGAADYIGEHNRFEVKITQGIISAFSSDASTGTKYYQTDAAFNAGNSGGPMFTECAQVIGVNTAHIVQTGVEGLGYAIMIDELLPELDRLGIRYTTAKSPCTADSQVFNQALAAREEAKQATNLAGIAKTDAEKAKTEAGSARMEAQTAKTLAGTAKEDAEKAKTEAQTAKQEAEVARARAESARKLTLVGVAGMLLLGVAFLIIALARRGRVAVRDADSPGIPDSEPTPLTTWRPILRGIAGEFAGKEIELDAEPLTIGRSPELCQLVFPPGAIAISKCHCTLSYDVDSHRFLLKDNHSTNGTFLASGEAVSADVPSVLKPGEGFYLSHPQNGFEVRLEERP